MAAASFVVLAATTLPKVDGFVPLPSQATLVRSTATKSRMRSSSRPPLSKQTGRKTTTGTTTNLGMVAGENRQKLRENQFATLSGLGLAFNSGYINGCCLSGMLGTGVGIGVSAFTGAYTTAGLALGSGNIGTFVALIKLISSFVLGASVFGMINPYPKPNRLSPRYGPTFLLGSVFMALSTAFANIHSHPRAYLYFAAMANGLQNAATSAYSQNLVRTSHMSGITSDLGMLMGQIVRGNFANAWRCLVLFGLATSFLSGGVVSYLAVKALGSKALFFSSGLYLWIALTIIGFTSYQQKITLWRAATGNWKWKNSEKPSKQVLESVIERHSHSMEDETTSKTAMTVETTESGEFGISEEEFKEILEEVGVVDAPDYGLHAVFESIDSEHKGSITKDEVLAMLLEGREDSPLMLECDEETGECELVMPANGDSSTTRTATKGFGSPNGTNGEKKKWNP